MDELVVDFMKRRKVIYVTHQRLLRLMLSHKIFANHVVVPQPKGIPDSAVVRSVYLDPSRNAFGVVICDTSYDVVDDALTPPELTIDWVTVDIQRPEGNEKP